ncbi:MAG: SDR family oxidoreductase [Acidobacteriota bacterium]
MPIPAMNGVSVLVTGGAGFIGSHLVDALVERGGRVRVLDNFATGLASNLDHLDGKIEVIEGDIRDLATCQRACDGTRVVFHQAALGSVPRSVKDPATSIAVNVGGTANIFAAARDAGTARVVYASSSSVYGDSPTLPKTEGDEGKPLSPYATSKWMCEELAAVYGLSYPDLVFVGLRYFNVYGPRQRPDGPYAAVIPKFFDAYRQGQAPKIHGDGEQSRDFTYVLDAVRANLLASGAGDDACGRAYNVAGGRRITVNELAARVREASGGGHEPEHGPPRPGDVRHSLADLSASQRLLGYQPETGLDVGIGLAANAYLGR